MADLEQAEHVIELMVLAAWADGRVEGTEAQAVQRLASREPLLHGHGPVGDVSKITHRRLVSEGMEQCLLASVRGLKDKPYRELGFQCAAKVMGKGNRSSVEEDRLLSRLQTMLGFQPADVERLLVVAAAPRLPGA